MTSFRQKSVLVILSVTFTLSLIEVTLRIINYDPLKVLQPGSSIMQLSSDPRLEYELIPKMGGQLWNTDVQVNSDGFRDREFVPDRFDGERIVVLGDSIAFGFRLPLTESIPKLLEENLRSQGKKVEVLNMGMVGYNIFNEVSLLEAKGLKYRPSTVIVIFCINDLGDSSGTPQFFQKLRKLQSSIWTRSRLAQFFISRYFLILGEAKFLEDVEGTNEQLFVEKSRKNYGIEIEPESSPRVLRIVKELATSVATKRNLGERVPFYSYLYTSPYRLGFLRYSFRKLAKLKSDHQFQILVALVPHLSQEQTGFWSPVFELVSGIAEEEGLRALNLYQAFEGKNLGDFQISETDVLHPNAKGNRLIAELLARWVMPR